MAALLSLAEALRGGPDPTDPSRGPAGPGRSGGMFGVADTPANFSSHIGPVAGGLGTALGLGLGVPGLGMGFGALGEMADANRYAGVLGQHGINMTPNYGQAALYGASPFGMFGTGARQQSENARRDFLGQWGPTPGNVAAMPSPVGPVDWATDPMNFDANSPSKDFGPGGFGATGNDMGGGISTSGGQDPGPGGKGDVSGGGDKGPGGGGWYAAGGTVRPPAPGVPNPPGPDDQMAGLQTGEGVLTRAAMQRYPGLVTAANAGLLGGLYHLGSR